jgi:hypothetical protein
MTLTPTFAIPPTFLGAGLESAATRFWVAGVPLDIGTTNRAGARAGPLAVRHASRMLVDGDNPTNWRDPSRWGWRTSGISLALGDLPASLARSSSRRPAFPISSPSAVTTPSRWRCCGRWRSGPDPLGMVHFDAHVDTWPDNFGQPFAHGSVFYHAIIEGLIDPAAHDPDRHPFAGRARRLRVDVGAGRAHRQRRGGPHDRPAGGRRSRARDRRLRDRSICPSTSTPSIPGKRPAPVRPRSGACSPGR